MKKLLIIMAVLAALPGAAQAGPGDRVALQGWGPRFGVTSDPSQVHFGLHLDLGDFAERFRFQPNVEVGLGDRRTLAAFNMETAYQFASNLGQWSPYAGGGLGLNLTGRDNGIMGSRSDSQLGASVLGGIEKGMANGDRMFLEAKFGLVDSPSLKLAVGWTFY